MQTFNNISLNLVNGILTITITRASKMNALNAETMKELADAFEIVYTNNDVKGVILTGEGEKAFVAGADIAEFIGLSKEKAENLSKSGSATFTKIEKCKKPVIAAVNGFALGGGCELAMACHMRIASENAKFGQPEVNLGLIPGYGGTQRLVQLVGKGKAYELMVTADMISAEEAKNLGLVNHVTTLENLIPKSTEILTKIMAKAPVAVGIIADCVHAVFNEKIDGYQLESEMFGVCFGTNDFKEGTSAFVEKRKAEFKGN
jgi:enoyl-CoA hydratase